MRVNWRKTETVKLFYQLLIARRPYFSCLRCIGRLWYTALTYGTLTADKVNTETKHCSMPEYKNTYQCCMLSARHCLDRQNRLIPVHQAKLQDYFSRSVKDRLSLSLFVSSFCFLGYTPWNSTVKLLDIVFPLSSQHCSQVSR